MSTISTITHASIGGTVSAGGDVVVRSSDDTQVTIISGALGAGFVGVGASVRVLGSTRTRRRSLQTARRWMPVGRAVSCPACLMAR
ncbi:MAG: hypothetical protein MZV64_15830 [Ignavibacteriales bacterium]|nr:hypothetical protein [Ignavibacteriales bacterium]